mmetsp:Transcript_21828/g.24367  ORF Transcript_21828/g.24367 Transcript_21828/m.24367 type:complete len:126 (+) Transcript_21828:451-828(+)
MPGGLWDMLHVHHSLKYGHDVERLSNVIKTRNCESSCIVVSTIIHTESSKSGNELKERYITLKETKQYNDIITKNFQKMVDIFFDFYKLSQYENTVDGIHATTEFYDRVSIILAERIKEVCVKKM